MRNAVMTQWHRYWLSITPRERRLLMLAGSALALAVCYFLLWQPWQQRSEQWQRTLVREQQTVAWLRQQAPRIAQAAAPSTSATEESRHVSLPVLISQSSSRYGLKAARLQPQGNQVAVTLERSDFTLLMQWLGEMEQLGVSVLQLDVNAVDGAPGRVDISKLVMERVNES
ncbi:MULTISPECIES: type II secretion system protein M [unclassified Symbiopectobacterium]|uniref:type II secretion system protein M n=1 Tax=unclassified Symbiopectobacterium TaxID=2794573 RepID=UPI002225D963|nr:MULTISPECIES: type II secretion system protein M [unclassified Symbiopectobacterium]MCW2475830.1 type II secretion system protein M [Candidatus Symbiopectobacterium sp. NZEC151]MCW2485988.1 type II secretion system protein M [Candidatus Symbiopectobacterium sp. NZEC127]